ncbi:MULTISPECIES: TetR/AcrR family transcriptional regulator [Clostridium]|uniref:HTH-type transcriptional regulator BetI n=3 Tax=Clostridium TaxID=1485 RepID=D8GNH6_CLOLD|nr:MULTISPECIES: TetR/AcrR family transcriptional regulator [Clostridium]ADK15839.1 conserved hypothetical protein [Clostridium ljungdahlii DSM 13528]OAA84290.1 HTH-type transcriptional regulator BetI [Clostridium ljungdahlii DSM 13528]OAA87960.1 HTH-type transcriptional regulator BetI [Clostridium coskatii]OBR97595.1 HTH-type transcriptional regulator BetI [Clostridium coskatii]RMC99621.1 TetR/AcrR family transcriptional regulator [Clostridium autoethanogenum]
MVKKTIKKHRNMSYFIDAASKIMDEEGVQSITIRKVADMAGYNSATLYNYFENLDELILYASIRHLREYTFSLSQYINALHDNIDKYYEIWKYFCKYSFSNPEIYNNIFFVKHSNSISNIIEEYYSIFPEELGDHSENLLPMLLKSNLYERNLALLKIIADNGYLKPECLNDLNQMTILLYQGMLNKILNDEQTSSVEECSETMLRYIKQLTTSFIN